MALTYEPIQRITVTSQSSAVFMQNIPQTYTDLRLVIYMRNGAGTTYCQMWYNGVTTGYGQTAFRRRGQGDFNAGGTGTTNDVAHYVTWWNTTANSTDFATKIVDIFGYTSTTDKKASIMQAFDWSINNTQTQVGASIGHWNSTSAITRIDLTTSSNFQAGTQIVLYGIKGA